MTRLILVRHGETAKNASEKLHVINDSSRLSEAGLRQIADLAEKLKRFTPNTIYTSSEVRAKQSAQLLAKKLGISLKVMDNLRERDWGEYSDRDWPSVQAELEKMPLDQRYAFVPPAGESWQQAEMRLIQVIRQLITEESGQTVVIVTHGGSIRILMPYFLNLPKEESFKHNPDNASMTIFDYDGEHFSQIS